MKHTEYLPLVFILGLQLVLLVLKLTNVVTANWLIVCFPVIAVVAVLLISSLSLFIFAILKCKWDGTHN